MLASKPRAASSAARCPRARGTRRAARAPPSAFEATDAATVAGVLGLAYVGWSVTVYSKVTFALARLIGQKVPKGSRCVELNADSKNLYYYPPEMEIVTAVGNAGDKLSERQYQFDDATAKTGVACVCVDDAPERLSSVRDASADAVVTNSALAVSRDPDAVLDEVFRVLKPDGVFVFVEMINGAASGNLDKIKSRPEVKAISVDEEFLGGAKPHAVGYCTKSVNTTAAEQLGGKRKGKAKKRSGFGG